MKSVLAWLGPALAIFSLSASLHAADATPATPAAASAAPGASGTATPQAASGAHAKAPHAHRATKHPAHARGPTMAMTATGTGNPAYRAALRDCVAGPAGRRDSCLDNAIARFGQS